VLGSDARPDQDVLDANTDAMHLVGVDPDRGRAAGIGIPRDSWVELPGHGMGRINTALAEGGPDLAAAAVADLTTIEPDYVLVVRMEDFVDLVGTVGTVVVESPTAFHDDEFDLTVRRGPNRFDPEETLSYSRSRRQLDAGDFERSANQQRVMLGILEQMRAQEDDEGFMETGALNALRSMGTDLSPVELYRLAQAVTMVRPERVTTCVVSGTTGDLESGASVVFPDEEQAARLGRDAVQDAQLEPGCDG
jgi:LCP family protein required for cell wall assembly